jgi:type IV pilus assembly protein PilW
MTTVLPLRARQSGVTLTELMIALVLGALVVLAGTAMVVTSRGTYRSQDEGTRLAESGRFGLELADRMVRLSGYTNFGDDPGPPPAYRDVDYTAWTVSPDSYAMNGPAVVGSDNSKPGGAAGLNGSDSLTIRFYGTSTAGTTTVVNGGTADGNVIDCAGVPVPQPAQNETAYTQARDYNVLFVDTDSDGEPALKCRRLTYDASGNPTTTFDTQTLIRGVESFQVLYGEAIPQAAPNNDLDTYPPASIVYRTGIGGSNPVGNWANVLSVRIAMLLRTATGTRPDPEPATVTYHLLGTGYAASSDPGVDFSLATLSTAERTRVRRVVQTTVFLRNRVSTWPSLQQ